MEYFKKIVHQNIQRAWASSLYRNSLWLIGGSFVMAGFGFFYWLIAARIFTPTEIGLATTFLSAASLINGFAILGFTNTLIRYLPTSQFKEKKINTSFTVVSLVSILLGVIYIIFLPFWTEKLLFLRTSIPLAIAIILFFPINTLNNITDSVFTAYQKAHWVFVSNIVQSVSKLLLLALVSTMGTWGIINSNIFSVIIAVVVCLVLIAKRFTISFRPTIDWEIIKIVRRFALGNYISGLISTLPGLIMPILITNRLSPEQTAYFYIPSMLANLLGVIPNMISRSYMSESSLVDRPLSIKRPLLFTYTILVPSIGAIILFSRPILTLFGHIYATQGYLYLDLISLSVLLSVINYFLGTKLLVQHRVNTIIVTNLIASLIYIAFSWKFIPYGIVYIGLAANIYHLVSTMIYLIAQSKFFERKK